jgi:NAD-dependent SIR2 family protein deacetylase
MFWELTAEIEKIMSAAKPNPAHITLAQFEALGKVKAIITQVFFSFFLPFSKRNRNLLL